MTRTHLKDPEKIVLKEIISRVAPLGTITNMTILVIFAEVISNPFGYAEHKLG